MAKLLGESAPGLGYFLEINPLVVIPDGAGDAYEVSLQDDGEVVFSRTCPGHRDELGHYYLQLIAEAFSGAATILGNRLAFENLFGERYEVQGSVNVGNHFITLGLTGYQSEDGAEWLDVEIRLLSAAKWTEPPEGRLVAYEVAFLRTSRSGAERFGRELSAHLDQAAEVERQRYCAPP